MPPMPLPPLLPLPPPLPPLASLPPAPLKAPASKPARRKAAAEEASSVGSSFSQTAPPLVTVTAAKAFFATGGCERFLALSRALRGGGGSVHTAAVAAGAVEALPAAAPTPALDAALAEAGQQQEEAVLELLEAWLEQQRGGGREAAARVGSPCVGNASGKGACSWDDVAAALPALVAARACAAWREVALPAGGAAPPELGVRLAGRIDFLLLTYEGNGEGEKAGVAEGTAAAAAREQRRRPVLVVAECKSSPRAEAAHFAQLALYRLALRALLRDGPGSAALRAAGVVPAALRCVLVTAASLPHPVRRRWQRASAAEAAAKPAERLVAAADAARWVDAAIAAAGRAGGDGELVSHAEGDVIAQLRPGGAAARALLAGERARGVGGSDGGDAARTTRAASAAAADLEDLPFSYGAHCGGCPALEAGECRRRAAARGAVQLTGCGAGAAAALRAEGVGDLASLAALADGDDDSGGAPLAPRPPPSTAAAVAARVRARVPGLSQWAERARLLVAQQREQQGQQKQRHQHNSPPRAASQDAAQAGCGRPTLGARRTAAAPQVCLRAAAAPHGALPPRSAAVARAYLAIEADAVTRRVAAVAAHCCRGAGGCGCCSGGSGSGAGATPPLLLEEPCGVFWSTDGGGGGGGSDDLPRGGAATFVRRAPLAYATDGEAAVAAAGGSSGGALALVALGDDLAEAKLLAEALGRVLRAARGAASLHLFTWAAGDAQRLAARCGALLTRPGVAGGARLEGALRAWLLLLGSRGALAGLPGADPSEQAVVTALGQELAARFTTPLLRPGLVEAAALRWPDSGGGGDDCEGAATNAPPPSFDWARTVRPHGGGAANGRPAADVRVVDVAALWALCGGWPSSGVAPALFAARWWLASAAAAATAAGGGGPDGEAPAGAPPLPRRYAAYAAAAASGALEALVARKAAALAFVEARMQAAGGADHGVVKAPLRVLQAADPAAAAAADADARWHALTAPSGLVAAAVDAVRLDRAAAAAGWLADACAPLAERVAAGRSLLLKAPAVVDAAVLFRGSVVSGDNPTAAASAAAAAPGSDGGSAAPLPFAPGDFVRATGLFASEVAAFWSRGAAAAAVAAAAAHPGRRGGGNSAGDGINVRAWLERRGANCIVTAVDRDPATGAPRVALAPAYAKGGAGGGAALLARHYHVPPLLPPRAFGFDFVALDAGAGDYLGAAVDAALADVAAAAAAAAAATPEGGAGGGGNGDDGADTAAERASAWLALLSGGSGAPEQDEDEQRHSEAEAAAAAAAAAAQKAAATRLLSAVRWNAAEGGGGAAKGRLQPDQVEAVAAGLPARVQLIQGPPGTGKTEALAAAVAAALLLQPGCRRVGVVAHTHAAIDNALARLLARLDAYRAAAGRALGGTESAAAAGAAPERLAAPLVARAASKERAAASPALSALVAAGRVLRFDAARPPAKLKRALASAGAGTGTGAANADAPSCLVVAASPSDMLKLAAGQHKAPADGAGAATAASPLALDLLVVDEASMLAFPAALAVAARLLRARGGRLVLAGDHRQLAAIARHGFEADRRPSVALRRAWASAYDYVWALGAAGARHPAVAVTQLRASWRFARFDRLRELIGGVYARDGLELTAPTRLSEDAADDNNGGSGEGGAVTTRARTKAALVARRRRAAAPAPVAEPLLVAAGARGYGTAAVVAAMAVEPCSDDDGDSGSGGSGSEVGSDTGTMPAAAASGIGGGGDDSGAGDAVWRRVWAAGRQLVLVVHGERGSATHNALEVEVVTRLLAARPASGGADDIAVVSPHRAQCAALRAALQPAARDGATGNASPPPRVDTVERLQGGEAATVVLSATASCPAALAANGAFYASPHRANVALSRARERLVVVASEAMLAFAPPGGGGGGGGGGSAERYAGLALWKALRAACREPLGAARVGGEAVRVFAAPAAALG